MVLNLIGVAFYMGLWDNDEPWRSLYHILQASRLVILWQVLHWLGPTSKGKRRTCVVLLEPPFRMDFLGAIRCISVAVREDVCPEKMTDVG